MYMYVGERPEIAKFMRPTWGPPGPVGLRLAPSWPHEPCYQGPSTMQTESAKASFTTALSSAKLSFFSLQTWQMLCYAGKCSRTTHHCCNGLQGQIVYNTKFAKLIMKCYTFMIAKYWIPKRYSIIALPHRMSVLLMTLLNGVQNKLRRRGICKKHLRNMKGIWQIAMCCRAFKPQHPALWRVTVGCERNPPVTWGFPQ